MATTYNFPDHVRGDTMEKVSFNVTVNAVALDLTSAIIKMDLRKASDREVTDGTLLKNFTTVASGGITITDAANGEFEIDEQVVDVIPGTHNYDIEITLSGGEVKTYISGDWTIKQDISNVR